MFCTFTGSLVSGLGLSVHWYLPRNQEQDGRTGQPRGVDCFLFLHTEHSRVDMDSFPQASEACPPLC